MMRNHQHILSIRKRCAKAKEELSLNLHTRLKWVMYIQVMMTLMMMMTICDDRGRWQTMVTSWCCIMRSSGDWAEGWRSWSSSTWPPASMWLLWWR